MHMWLTTGCSLTVLCRRAVEEGKCSDKEERKHKEYRLLTISPGNGRHSVVGRREAAYKAGQLSATNAFSG